MGHLSKAIVDTANKNIREAMGLSQWKNTDTVIDWFKSIRNKHLCKFVVFDIREFYPSITENLLKKALTFAEAHTHLSDDDKAIIHHARKSSLFNDQRTWIKRDSGLFHVTMGAYDEAEVCELVGNCLFYELSKLYEKNDIGFYRDDGLAVFKNKSGPESEKIKTSIQAIFRENELKITIHCNLKIVDYLDVTFNLTDSSYRPFNKTNNEINYIHKQSNHPTSIIKQLSLSVERRLSKLSSNEKNLNDSIPIYQEALIKAGYNHKLPYQKHDQKKDNPQQRRQIIWLNPLYSKNVTTKVGKFFLNLIDKHFPPHGKLHKLFNRNSAKISYSGLPNIKSIINAHNRKVLYPSPAISRRTCNCINTSQCPLQQRCLSNNILYKANITPLGENLETKVYYGICETTFQLRYANHKKLFSHRNRKSDTELSNEFWRIKDKKRNANITWKILGRHQAYNTGSKRCSLCLNEKLKIVLHKDNKMLNRRTEILDKCRHKNKYALISYDSQD